MVLKDSITRRLKSGKPEFSEASDRKRLRRKAQVPNFNFHSCTVYS